MDNEYRGKDRIAKVRSAFDAFKKNNHDGDLDKLTSFTRSHPIKVKIHLIYKKACL